MDGWKDWMNQEHSPGQEVREPPRLPVLDSRLPEPRGWTYLLRAWREVLFILGGCRCGMASESNMDGGRVGLV